MGTSLKCSCCGNEEKTNEIRYGINQYGFKVLVSFNLISFIFNNREYQKKKKIKNFIQEMIKYIGMKKII